MVLQDSHQMPSHLRIPQYLPKCRCQPQCHTLVCCSVRSVAFPLLSCQLKSCCPLPGCPELSLTTAVPGTSACQADQCCFGPAAWPTSFYLGCSAFFTADPPCSSCANPVLVILFWLVGCAPDFPSASWSVAFCSPPCSEHGLGSV